MFKTERELINTITANQANLFSFTNWNNQTNTTILDELDLGYGVADLVVAKYSVPNLKRTEPLNYNDIFIYKILEQTGALTVSDIRETIVTKEKTGISTASDLFGDDFLDDIIRGAVREIDTTGGTVAPSALTKLTALDIFGLSDDQEN